MDNFVSVKYILILDLTPINQNLCVVNFKNDLWYESYKLQELTYLEVNE